MLKVRLHGGGACWISAHHISWLDDSDTAGWGAAVNPSADGIQVLPTSTPGAKTRIGVVGQDPVIAAHSAIEIIRAMGLTNPWDADGIIVAEDTPV